MDCYQGDFDGHSTDQHSFESNTRLGTLYSGRVPPSNPQSSSSISSNPPRHMNHNDSSHYLPPKTDAHGLPNGGTESLAPRRVRRSSPEIYPGDSGCYNSTTSHRFHPYRNFSHSETYVHRNELPQAHSPSRSFSG